MKPIYMVVGGAIVVSIGVLVYLGVKNRETVARATGESLAIAQSTMGAGVSEAQDTIAANNLQRAAYSRNYIWTRANARVS